MRGLQNLLFALPLAFASTALVDVRDASACGGCLVPPSENTQVSGHRMILSISNDKTTLWDQIEYTGNPSSFAWVLPIKGQVEVGLSSDALFETLEAMTQVTVNAPWIPCSTEWCSSGGGGAGGGGGGPGGGGEVTVITQEVVGPYETVQLSSSDANALKTWLTDNNFAIPPDISGVIDAYVADGFDFLALKLVPGEGVDAMRPVRITAPGAAPGLPLRMVAAGTGAVTPISLWVIGEGRYEPSNFPAFEINEKDLVWDWDTSSSNYKELRAAGFAATEGKGWLVENAWPELPSSLDWALHYVISNSPNSGYGDAQGAGATEELKEDLDALHGSIDPSSMWLTRLYAELPRSALANDLKIGASLQQTTVPGIFYVAESVGTPPACPAVPECPTYPTPADKDQMGSGYSMAGGGGGCAVGGGAGSSAVLGGLALSMGLAIARRRRRSSGRR